MLERVEIVPSSRQTVRRAVEIGCELVSPGGAYVERMLDLSPRGARVRSRERVRRGADVLLTFVPPGAPRRVSALGIVQHAEDGVLGVQFTSLDRIDADTLDRHLRGLPPPLPAKTRRKGTELVWVDTLLTYEEDLGDRIHVYEVSEQLSMEIDLPGEIAPLAAPLGGGSRYRWRLA